MGQCFWPIGRGSVLYLQLMQAWCRGVGAFVTGVLEVWEWAWGRFVNMTAGSVAAFFIHFSRVSVFERGWAWGVFSPMTDGSVGAFFIYF